MNKAELIHAMAAETKMTKIETKKAVEAFISTVSKSLKKGDRVTLIGFGSWNVIKRVARKAISHLTTEYKQSAITELIKNYLEPSGNMFVEELVYRFLLTRGDTLGGMMRNIGGGNRRTKINKMFIIYFENYRLQIFLVRWCKLDRTT